MFSKSTEYALRAVIYIARESSIDKKLGIAEIAASIDSPRSFTAKILQLLTADNKIISSVRGPNGGFYIAENAKKLPVRSILKAMGEDEMLGQCVLGLKKCSDVKPCPMHMQYKIIKEKLIALFENKTIGDLAAEMAEGNSFINNRNKGSAK
jgi:Rrf2 family transcriptional regulator, iron-sulfur cluster assembly transcription factor